MNDFILLKSIGEGIAKLRSKYLNAPDSEKDKLLIEIEKLSNEYKKIYQLSLEKSLIVTDDDVVEMGRLKKEIDNCATGAEILEAVKNFFLFICGISSNIISNVKK
ncbi:MAG TPA: hypothetical protein PK385_06450 [Spirochaetota bacterium]|nr:hypothetical protein [Spirochaetota bacterium]HOS32271.1 hypothetical protein [Spirochaetota bacterium]HOS55682.1 hypothetical protein [Spirochaetota bacterium]HPK61362.1 hypothetical protein [Spirochaetota bacterium]HQF78069.1 hypothetical protein [Spirochaetota bacterium]